MKKIDNLLKEHPFFRELPEQDVTFIAGCGQNQVFKTGKYLAHESDPADFFYVIRSGKVAVELHSPGRGGVVLETLGPGEVLGWSWLFPPYRWSFDVRVVEEAHLIALDGRCVRQKAESDTALGFRLMKKFSAVMTERLRAARVQLVDLYGTKVS